MTEPGAGPPLSELLSYSTNPNPFNLPSRFLPPAHQPSQLHAHRCSARTYAEHLWRFVEHWRFVLAVHPNDYLVSCPMNHERIAPQWRDDMRNIPLGQAAELLLRPHDTPEQVNENC